MKNKTMMSYWLSGVAGMVLSLFFACPAFGSKAQIAPGLEVMLQSDFNYAAEKDKLRDPFKTYIEPPAVAAGPTGPDGSAEPEIKPPELKIQGIFWGGAFPQAIVNGRVVRVNDQIEGAVISRIAKEGITIKIGYKEFIYNAPGQSTGVRND
jgi:hypothetical protein